MALRVHANITLVFRQHSDVDHGIVAHYLNLHLRGVRRRQDLEAPFAVEQRRRTGCREREARCLAGRQSDAAAARSRSLSSAAGASGDRRCQRAENVGLGGVQCDRDVVSSRPQRGFESGVIVIRSLPSGPVEP